MHLLQNQFCILLFCILQQAARNGCIRFFICFKRRNAHSANIFHKRDLCPNQQPVLITQIIKMRMVGIMRKADCIGAHLVDQRKILLVFPVGNRPAHIFPVLVAVHTPKRTAASVQEKSIFRIYAEIAKTDILFHTIANAAVLQNLTPHFIAKRRFSAVPKMGRRNAEC